VRKVHNVGRRLGNGLRNGGNVLRLRFLLRLRLFLCDGRRRLRERRWRGFGRLSPRNLYRRRHGRGWDDGLDIAIVEFRVDVGFLSSVENLLGRSLRGEVLVLDNLLREGVDLPHALVSAPRHDERLIGLLLLIAGAEGVQTDNQILGVDADQLGSLFRNIFLDETGLNELVVIQDRLGELATNSARAVVFGNLSSSRPDTLRECLDLPLKSLDNDLRFIETHAP